MRFLASQWAAGSWRRRGGVKEWLAVSFVGAPCWASAGWLVSAWSGVGRRAVLATDSVQRGRTGEASAQSITISHSTRCVWVSCRAQRGCPGGWKNGRRKECARQTQRSCRSATGGEVPLSEQRRRRGARTPCKARGCCAKGERGCATGGGVRVTARLSCFDVGSGGRRATGGRRDWDWYGRRGDCGCWRERGRERCDRETLAALSQSESTDEVVYGKS